MQKQWPMWAGLVLGLGALAAGLAYPGETLDQWSAATRYTARVGFPLFILAYIARPLVDLTRSDWSKALLGRRKWLGNGFAISHTIHLFAIVMLFRELGTWPELPVMLGGGFAYLLLFSMAATSNRAAMKALGRNWKRLHSVGMHYLWFVFAQSYLGRIFEQGTAAEGVVFSAVALIAAGLRLAAWIKVRRRRASRKAQQA